MALESLTIKEKLCITLDSTSASIVVPILNYVPYAKSGYRLIDEYLEINDLKAVSWIYSLTPVAFPVFELEDTESKQLLAAINLEWQSPRFRLDIMIKIDNQAWQRIHAFSLLNPSPYPYREYSLGSHTLGNNAMIGLKITDAGYGLLTGQDKVTCYSDLTRIITIEKLVDTSIKIANNITTIAATVINSNSDRKGLTLFNSSSINVFIDSSPGVTATSYLVKLEPGDYWESPTPLYVGAYYAIVASGSTAIDIREFV